MESIRNKLLLASLAIIFTGPLAAADTAISGVVVALEPASNAMVLRRDGAGELVTVILNKGRLDSSIIPGTHVTAGGKFRPGTTGIFDAHKIKSRKSNVFGFDPTGVRKRLAPFYPLSRKSSVFQKYFTVYYHCFHLYNQRIGIKCL